MIAMLFYLLQSTHGCLRSGFVALGTYWRLSSRAGTRAATSAGAKATAKAMAKAMAKAAVGMGIAVAFAIASFAPVAIALPLSQLAPERAPTLTIETPSAEAPSPAILFEQNCAGCHVNGGNIIRRGKNLKRRAMVRNGYGEVDAIAHIITNGKGIMSAYGDRLNETEINAIAQYVHEKSEAGW